MKTVLAVCLLAIALPCAAQPRLVDAQVTTEPFRGTLESTIKRIGDSAGGRPVWIAWAAPIADGRSNMCCYADWSGGNASGGRCRLEPGSSSTIMSRERDRTLRLELPESFFVFVRVEKGQVERVRMFSEDCEIVGGAAPVTWLTDVPPPMSVGLLSNLADQPEAANRARKGALSALAQHGVPEALTSLIRLARQAPDREVRGEALFWLSQRAGERAAAAITEAIEQDPETQVKKKAVFALSQLPADQGVPKLIEVARSHGNPAVRKQAMFWLGQSKDPRALAFFEEILK